MRNGPELAAWDIFCPSPTAARAVQELLTSEASLDRVQVVTVQGGGATSEERHRLGDYFRAIRVAPAAATRPNVLRLVFERHTHAGRYWRDLMVRILQAIEGLG